MRKWFFLVSILAACAIGQAAAADNPELVGKARFEVFGMLNEYIAHFTDGHTVERFSPYEVRNAARFDSLLQEFCKEEGIAPAFEKEVNPQGFITFVSAIVAAKVDRYYTHGVLNKSVFVNASTGDLLRYVRGAYLRDGANMGVAMIGQANGPNKMTNVGRALQKLGCSHVQLYCLEGFPTGFTLVFSPSPIVKKRLGLQAEVRFLRKQDIGERVPL